MPVPTYDQFIEPLLRFLAQNPNGVNAKEAHEAAARMLNLSDSERQELLPSGVQPVYKNKIRLKRGHMRTFTLILIATLFMGLLPLHSEGAPPTSNQAALQQKRQMDIAQGKKLYEQKCSACHQPKALSSRTLPEWNKLVYGSGCSDVTIPLKLEERKLLQTYIGSQVK